MRPKNSHRYLYLFLGLLSLGILSLVSVYSSTQSYYIFLWGREQITEIRPEISNAYTAPNKFPEFSSHFGLSLANILENGKEIGPSNALHDYIRETGLGANSIWNASIYFSASDNSDPRVNGQNYELEYPVFYLNRVNLLQTLGFLNIILILALIYLGLAHYTYVLSKYAKPMKFLWILTLGTLSLSQVYFALPGNIRSEMRTWWYIQTFDPERYETMGADYCAPERIDTQKNEIYDYRRIEKASVKLEGVDRQKALLAIFRKVTKNASSNTEKHVGILGFIHKSSSHLTAQALGDGGLCISDPLLVLELGDMWCGQAAYLAIDLLGSAGYKGRMVQLGQHQIAEIYYDGDWHYLDADVFGNGQTVFDKDGTIPSVEELSHGNFYQDLDALPGIYHENLVATSCIKPPSSIQIYPSYYYFSSNAYKPNDENPPNVVPSYYYKGASMKDQEADNLYYGWPSAQSTPTDEIILANRTMQSTPLTPIILNISFDKEDATFTITFNSSDPDDDLIGYRVFVSTQSRGWNYNSFNGSNKTKQYWSNPAGWDPSMYERLFSLPPADIDLITIPGDQNQVEILIEPGVTYYITIMPFDSYGEQVGRELYPASNELVFTTP